MGRPINEVTDLLSRLAPPSLAEEWDNVGLLVEPTRPRTVGRLFLTIDLTEPVLDEAIEAGTDFVVAYHPVIFAPLGRLTTDDPKARTVLRAVEVGLPVYSPHTALDAALGGVNDWLADGLGDGERRPVQPRPEDPTAGQGRVVTLHEPVDLETLVGRIKMHTGLTHVRVADPGVRSVRTVALCPGAGGSVVGDVEADLYLTGEMRHHRVLAATARGTAVVVTDHTNTERGYLPRLARELEQTLGDVEVRISSKDRDPLRPA